MSKAKENRGVETERKFLGSKDSLGVLIALVVALVLLVSGYVVTFLILKNNPQAEIGTSIVRDINIVLISTTVTLLGLYVTAFIFLNDSLKSRSKEDRTIKEALGRILLKYRVNMYIISIGTIVTVALEVVCNILLGEPQPDVSVENMKLALNSSPWYMFIFSTAFAIFIVAWIIVASKDIANSDDLIAKQSKNDLDFHEQALLELFDEVQALTAEVIKNPTGKKDLTSKNEPSILEQCLTSQQPSSYAKQLLEEYGKRKYNFGMAAYARFQKSFLKDGEVDVDKKLEEVDVDVKSYEDYLIQLGKTVRFIELTITKICDNNIDKSIMDNDLVFKSMESGFLWLYAKKSKSNYLDVRDINRFFDHMKYQIVTDKRFERKPFDNEEVEKAFGIAQDGFYSISNTINKASEYIDLYKDNMQNIIRRFFNGYKHLIYYRDAMGHYDKYSRKNKKQSTNSKDSTEQPAGTVGIQDTEKKIFIYAEVLKRVMIDRFTSFVKTNDLNLGNSTLDKGWFNYSELSESNFTHSSFRFARIENAIMRNCDLSTCSFYLADASDTDFSRCNFNYSDLTGMDLSDTILDHAQMDSVVFRDARLDRYGGFVESSDFWEHETPLDRKYQNEMLEMRQRSNSLSNDARNKLRHGEAVRSIVKDVSKHPDYYYQADGDDLQIGNGETCKLNSSFAIIKGKLGAFSSYHRYHKVSSGLLKELKRVRESETEPEKNSRESHHGRVNFCVATLRQASVNNVSMKSIDMSHVTIDNASFRDSDLSDGEMFYTKASAAMFYRTNLNGLDAYHADFAGSNFNEASIVRGVLMDCNFEACNFTRAVLMDAVFVYTKEDEKNPVYLSKYLVAADESETNLIRKLLEKSSNTYLGMNIDDEDADINCKDCEFCDAIANNMVMINVNASRSKFNDASVKNSFIYNSLMRWCDFTRADFSNGICMGVSFGQSNFRGAKFQRAKFVACELCDAGLVATNMISSYMENVLFEETNFRDCNLSVATIKNCTFSKCNFHGMIVSRTEFINCVFSRVSFDNVVGLDEAMFVNCVFDIDDSSGTSDADEITIGRNDGVHVELVLEAGTGGIGRPARYSTTDEQ